MPVAWSTFNFNIFNFSQLQTPFATRLASCTCRKLCALEEAAFVPLYLSTELQPGKTVCCENAQTANCRPQTNSGETFLLIHINLFLPKCELSIQLAITYATGKQS